MPRVEDRWHWIKTQITSTLCVCISDIQRFPPRPSAPKKEGALSVIPQRFVPLLVIFDFRITFFKEKPNPSFGLRQSPPPLSIPTFYSFFSSSFSIQRFDFSFPIRSGFVSFSSTHRSQFLPFSSSFHVYRLRFSSKLRSLRLVGDLFFPTLVLVFVFYFRFFLNL